MVTLLEGTMATAINDTAYLGPRMATSSLQNVAKALPLCEPGRGLGLTVACSWAKTPGWYNFYTPIQVCDFYIIFKY